MLSRFWLQSSAFLTSTLKMSGSHLCPEFSYVYAYNPGIVKTDMPAPGSGGRGLASLEEPRERSPTCCKEAPQCLGICPAERCPKSECPDVEDPPPENLCDDDDQDAALLVAVSNTGSVLQIHEVTYEGCKFWGQLSGLASSAQYVWTCARSTFSTQWRIFTFASSDVSSAGMTIEPISTFDIDGTGDRCVLDFEEPSQLLWVQVGDDTARAYSTSGGIPAGTSGRQLNLGLDVAGFAFFVNLFGDDYVAVARCARPGKSNIPCKIEWHNIQPFAGNNDASLIFLPAYTQPDDKDGQKYNPESSEIPPGHGTLAYAVRTPSGVASISHDSSIGSYPSRYFTVSFLACTGEHVTATQAAAQDPEDRNFLMRTPIMSTEARKSQDVLFVMYKGGYMVGPRPLLGEETVGERRSADYQAASSSFAWPEVVENDERRRRMGGSHRLSSTDSVWSTSSKEGCMDYSVKLVDNANVVPIPAVDYHVPVMGPLHIGTRASRTCVLGLLCF